MARPRRWSLPALGAAAISFGAAIALLVVGLVVLAQPDPTDPFIKGSPYRQNILLGAVGAGVLAELALVISVVRRYFTFFTTVSIAGTGIGTMALVIVLSVMSGFETDLRDKILGFNAHLLVT
ncbi:MAG TPA: hypothetical protein VML75_00600, partial [Kofleriaceae bacterium]|nr:hypothetical protein [Kofleriaceae bacterium]